MQIRGFLKTSAIEWPGKISAILFTSGCNFRCSFCHNPDLVDPKKLNKLPLISEKEIFTELEKRKKWLDAVVVTGGEPTLQPDLINFLKKVRELGLKVMLETNGSNPKVIAKLSNYQIANYFAIDIKGPLDKRYKEIIKLPSFRIANLKKTLEIITKSKIPFELRTTVVPGIHDEKTIGIMVSQIKNIVQSAKSIVHSYQWYLQTFSPKNCLDPEFEKIKPYSQEEMEKVLQIAKKILPNTSLR